MNPLNDLQHAALQNPLIGRAGDAPLRWAEPPWEYGLSFNG
jgi:hypothetical protein